MPRHFIIYAAANCFRIHSFRNYCRSSWTCVVGNNFGHMMRYFENEPTTKRHLVWLVVVSSHYNAFSSYTFWHGKEWRFRWTGFEFRGAWSFLYFLYFNKIDEKRLGIICIQSCPIVILLIEVFLVLLQCHCNPSYYQESFAQYCNWI